MSTRINMTRIFVRRFCVLNLFHNIILVVFAYSTPASGIDASESVCDCV